MSEYLKNRRKIWSIVDDLRIKIQTHLADPQSHHRKIAFGFGLVGLYVFVAKIAGAAREMAMAWRYGVGQHVDGYILVFNIVSWPISVWFSVLMVVAVPIISRAKSSGNSELSEFQKEFFGISIVISLLLTLFLVTANRYLLNDESYSIIGALNAGEVNHLANQLIWLVPLGILIGSLSVWVIATGSHQNSLFDGIPAVIGWLFLMLPRGFFSDPLVLGTIVGFFIQFVLLTAYLIRRKSLVLPAFSLRSALWRGFGKSAVIILVGQAVMGGTGIIDQTLVAELGVGFISALNYSNRIIGLAFSLVVLTVTRAILPVFSEATMKGEKVVSHLTLQWSVFVIIIGGIVTVFAFYLSPMVVKVLFERGAFSKGDTAMVVEALQNGLTTVMLMSFLISVCLRKVLLS